jgi:phage terminase large subunit
LQRLLEISRSQRTQSIELELCRRDVLYWFANWAWTYDPRAAEQGTAHIPLDLFPRQIEMVKWLDARVAMREDGLLEKSRDIGFTWVAGGYALHKWLFQPGFKTTFGSRKGEYVDRIGDPDSIFEKIRMMLRALPGWMLPENFKAFEHDHHMLMLNPQNENTIRGEGGDEMGRGGRSSIYFIDEAAFIERAERVEASTSANSDVRIWGSSVQGMGNLFARKRFGGGLRPDQIFRFHWTDDPRKTQEWAVKKQASMESHVWASEYDIDYSASVEGICIPAKWVDAAKRIRKLLPGLEPEVHGIAGLDVGAGGKAKSVFVARFGSMVVCPVGWGDPDTGETALRAIKEAQDIKIARSNGTVCKVKSLRYDSIGVGQGVQTTLKRMQPKGDTVTTSATNVGDPPSDRTWPDGQTSKEKFANLKAEAWWMMRDRFKTTYEMALFLEGAADGHKHPVEDLISLPDDSEGPHAVALSSQISLVKWEHNEKGKIIIESKKHLSGRGIASPDYADALALTFTGGSNVERWLKAFAA